MSMKENLCLSSAYNSIYQRVLNEIYLSLYKRHNVFAAPLIGTEQPRDLARQELPSNAARISSYYELD